MSFRDAPAMPRYLTVANGDHKLLMFDLDDIVAVVILTDHTKTEHGYVWLRSSGKMAAEFSVETTHAIMDAWHAYTGSK